MFPYDKAGRINLDGKQPVSMNVGKCASVIIAQTVDLRMDWVSIQPGKEGKSALYQP